MHLLRRKLLIFSKGMEKLSLIGREAGNTFPDYSKNERLRVLSIFEHERMMYHVKHFLTAQEIARQALPILKDNLVFPMLTYTDYADDFANVGDTIQIRKPPVYEAKEFNGTIETQDIVEDKVLVTMDKIADVSVEVTAKEMALEIENFTSQVIEPAAIAIAEKINRDGLELYKDIYTIGGTAGTTPNSLEDLAAARKMLNINKAPVFPRYAVWDPEADMNFSVIPAIVNAEKSGSTEALREGSIGRIQGVDNYMSQAIWNHTPGVSARAHGEKRRDCR